MKHGLRILLFADMWATLALGMLGPIYAIFVQEIGGDLMDASWAFFSFTLTSGIVIYLVSHWEDKVKHKEKLVLTGYFLTAMGCLSYFFVSNQFMLIISQIILGLGEAILVPAYDAMYSHFLDRKKEASEWGDWEAMRFIVTAIAAIIGGFITNSFGFKTLFMGMFIISLLSMGTTIKLFLSRNYLNSS